MSRLSVNEVIVVEGKYDKIRLESLLDATIVTTEGFGIFKNSEKQQLLRRMAQERGLLLLTDSDSAGFVIRNFLRGCVPADRLRHAYIPQLKGKERRKPSVRRMDCWALRGWTPERLSRYWSAQA